MFLPRFNDPTSKYFNEQIIVWIIRLVYLCYFIFFVVNFILGDITIFVKQTIAQKKLAFSMNMIIYLLYVIVNTNYFLQYY